MAGIGHNSGREDAPGQGWRKFAWQQARSQLLPKLPIEVVRLRVRRAQELGLPYKTYASLRASTGHDLIGFLFSSNALRVMRAQELDASRKAKLAALVRADRVALYHPKARILSPEIDASYPAPGLAQSWSATREHLRGVMRQHGAPADRYLLIGDSMLEKDWAEAAQAAGYLPADLYFDASAS